MDVHILYKVKSMFSQCTVLLWYFNLIFTSSYTLDEILLWLFGNPLPNVRALIWNVLTVFLISSEYFLEDCIQMTQFVPPPMDRKKKDKDEDGGEEDVCCLLCLFVCLFILNWVQKKYYTVWEKYTHLLYKWLLYCHWLKLKYYLEIINSCAA